MTDAEPESRSILEDLRERLTRAADDSARSRPFVTLAYAQSLDGSIAGQGHRTLALSGPGSLTLTHELRASHQAILVGIGTVLADDPRLNVRLVKGADPQAVVVDSRLRMSESSRLLANGRRPWLATTLGASESRERAMRDKGVDVFRLPSLDNGWVDLEVLLDKLAERGVSHVLVEGGSRILNSFLSARLADYVVLTLAPRFVGGVPALCQIELSPFPRLRSWGSERIGDDLIVAGELSWADE